MIDLNKLDEEIDKLFEKETSDSLTKWLLNKRLGNINKLIGNGKFVSMQSQRNQIFASRQKANFNQEDCYTSTNPINRRAA